MFAETLVLIAIALLVLFCVERKAFSAAYRHERLLAFLPGPRGLPVFRNFFDFNTIEKVFPNALKFGKQYGGIVKINMFAFIPAVQITDDKLIEYVLRTTNALDKGLPYLFLYRWLGTGLLTAEGEKWKKTRKIITPAFHFQILEQYVDVFHSASESLVRNLRQQADKDSFDVYPFINLCTLDIICETAMGTKINAQENSDTEYVRSVKEMCRIITDRTKNPLKIFGTLYQFSRDYWKEKRHLKVLHGFTDSIIKRRRKELLSNGAEEKQPKRRLAFLDLILNSTIDGRPMTDDEIRQEVDTFMFAGHDTTASGLCFALYCLAKNPDVQKKVVDELALIFGNDRNTVATYKHLQEMKYLETVIKETLRLYPSVPIFTRQPDKDIQYDSGILPYFSQLGIFVYGVHRNPEYYPDPERFDPDRFTPENQLKRPAFSYLAFSAGHRNCIGQKFAMLEMKSILSKILRHFEVLEAPRYEPRVVPMIVLQSLNGFMIRLEERT